MTIGLILPVNLKRMNSLLVPCRMSATYFPFSEIVKSSPFFSSIDTSSSISPISAVWDNKRSLSAVVSNLIILSLANTVVRSTAFNRGAVPIVISDIKVCKKLTLQLRNGQFNIKHFMSYTVKSPPDHHSTRRTGHHNHPGRQLPEDQHHEQNDSQGEVQRRENGCRPQGVIPGGKQDSDHSSIDSG